MLEVLVHIDSTQFAERSAIELEVSRKSIEVDARAFLPVGARRTKHRLATPDPRSRHAMAARKPQFAARGSESDHAV